MTGEWGHHWPEALSVPLAGGKETDNAARVRYTARMLDIPPRLRLVLTIAALGGLVFIVMGSLASAGGQQVGLDKVIHGAGYGLLGVLIVMGLPPIWYLPAMFGVVGAGVGLEFAQKRLLPGRFFEMEDVVANSTGLLVGMCVGFLARLLWGYVGSELATVAERRRLRRFGDGQVLFREGDGSDCFYLIRKGRVEILVRREGADVPLATAGQGEAVGEMGVIENLPRSATAIARGETVLYRLDHSDLEEKVGDQTHPALGLARVLAARLRAANARLAEPRAEICAAP